MSANVGDSGGPAPTDLNTDSANVCRPPRASPLDAEEHESGPAFMSARAQVFRRPPPAKLGAIDVGTNSIHLIMAEISPEGDFRVLGRDKDMVQLGKDGFTRHVLTHRAMHEGVQTLKRFTKMARLKGISRLRAVATSAVREATNGGDFVEAVRERLGLQLHVISAEEEARLIYLAVRHAVDLGGDDNLIMDIGGGSLELIVGNAARAGILTSAKLGASRLAELFLHNDPPAVSEIKALRRHIEEHLQPVLKQVGARSFARCIGTSGTVQCIAAVCAYRRGTPEIEPYTQLAIERAELKSLLADMQHLNRDQRLKMAGVDARRVDSVLAGSILLLMAMQAFGISQMQHCEMALREGIILDDIATHRAHLKARAMWPDPRIRSVIGLAERCNYYPAHAQQVSRLALELFDQLATLHNLQANYRDLLRYACLLHDIGYLISHRNHHKHSYYLIRNGGLQGFSEQEIEFVANLARYHRKGRPRKSHYSWQNLAREHRPAVHKLLPLVRMANALDRTHDNVVDALECHIAPRGIELVVRARKDAELELYMARRQAGFFERQLDTAIRIVLAGQDVQEKSHV